MTRPFRLRPPRVQDGIIRARVQRILVERFDRRVTVVEAGAGFGKTTALVRAMSENRLAPRGADIWFGCDESDSDEIQLLAGLAAASGAAYPTLESIAEQVESTAEETCLILDDAHAIAADSTGMAVLDGLIQALPDNGHVVIATRRPLPLATARLEAQHELARIDEELLALVPDEVEALADGSDTAGLTQLGGWPALISIAAHTGRTQAFLWEEVLTGLDPAQRELLTALVAVNAASLDVLHALVPSASAIDLDGIPMVHERVGRYAAHDLWIDRAADAFDPADLDDYRDRAIVHLLDAGDAIEATEICLRTDRRGQLLDALRAAVVGPTSPHSTVIRRWAGALDADERESAVGLYLRCLVERDTDPSTERCRDLAQAAADAFREAEDTDAEVYALGLLGYWYYKKNDAGGLTALYLRLTELVAADCEPARQYLAVSDAVLNTVAGDPAATLECLRSIPDGTLETGMAAIADWLEANALNVMGYDAREAAVRGRSREVWFPGVGDAMVASFWRAGDMDVILDWLASPPQEQGSRQDFVDGAWRTYICAGLGRLDEARHHQQAAEQHLGEASAWQIQLTDGFARILVEIESYNDDAAAAMTRELLERVPPEGPALQYYRNGLHGLYRWVPELRPTFDALEGGPLWHRDLGLTRAVVAAAEGDHSLAVDVALPDPATGMLSIQLGRGSWELLCAAWAAGNPDAERATRELLALTGRGGQRVLRSIIEHAGKPFAAAAKEILATIPVTPDQPLAISLLGPGAIRFGDDHTEPADWRRERVRALLGFLVLNPVTTREAAITALWPDADPEAGRRNFRSTLNLLHGVLEPARQSGDATAVVRADGPRLSIERAPWLTIDVWEIDRLIEEAERAEAEGIPSKAVAAYSAALDLYAGELLGDAGYAEWVTVPRERLRSRAVNAGVRAAELLVGTPERALPLAQRVLEIEPWEEAAHVAVIRSHAALGETSAAHRAIDTCHTAMAEVGGPTTDLDALIQDL